MVFDYFIAFFTLILISMGFGLYRKLRGSENVFVHALSFVPITCSFMTVACVAIWLLLVSFLMYLDDVFKLYNYKIFYKYFCLTIFISAPLLSLILGVLLLRRFARRNLKKYIYTAYTLVFIASGVFGLCLCLSSIAFPPWEKVDVGAKFSYETQRMPWLSNEHNLRISFKSGKIINLCSHTYDNRRYALYEFANGDIFMKADIHYDKSYIVSLEKEEVYLYKKGNKYKLNGESIYTMDSHGSAKQDIPEGTMIFFTYKKYLGNDTGSFESRATSVDDIENLPLFGKLETRSFTK